MREVLVDEPSSYSKRTQKSRETGAWHFPVEGSNDWLCVTRQQQEQEASSIDTKETVNAAAGAR